MLAWLTANWGTILISVFLVCVVLLIITGLIKKKKRGISSCGCNCAHCAMNGSCHSR